VGAERWTALLLVALVTGCGPLAGLTRPEGDGGWGDARREAELARRADAAAVDLGGGAAPASPAPLPPDGRLDLHTALALALTGNRRVAEARDQLDIVRQQVWETRGQLFPATTGAGRYTWNTDAQTTSVHLPPGLLPAGTSPPAVKIRDADFGTVNGTLTLPVDVTGELRHALRSAQAGYRGEQARLWATTLAEQVGVIRAYFQLLEARHLRTVTEQTVALDRQQLAIAESRFTAGRLTKNDLLVVQVALRNAEQQLRQHDLAIDQSRWTLNQAIGLAVDAPTEPVDVEERPNIPELAATLREAYAHNPLLLSLLEEQQQLDEAERSLAAGRLPRLAGGGTVDYSSSMIVQPQRVGGAFVGFTWDLGTDTRREARIAAARIAAEQNRRRVEQQLRELETAVRATQEATEERLAALDTAQAAIGQAEENLRIRQQQFDAGRAQSDDVLDAERLLASQRATLATALYQAYTRRAELQQLTGAALDAVVPPAR
jgi:outer membrane protein